MSGLGNYDQWKLAAPDWDTDYPDEDEIATADIPMAKRLDVLSPASRQTHAAKPSLLDPSFVYVDAAHTDIRKTFERIRAQPVWRKHEHK